MLEKLEEVKKSILKVWNKLQESLLFALEKFKLFAKSIMSKIVIDKVLDLKRSRPKFPHRNKILPTKIFDTRSRTRMLLAYKHR